MRDAPRTGSLLTIAPVSMWRERARIERFRRVIIIVAYSYSVTQQLTLARCFVPWALEGNESLATPGF